MKTVNQLAKPISAQYIRFMNTFRLSYLTEGIQIQHQFDFKLVY